MKLTPLGPNKTEVEINGDRVFFSYKTPVAVIRYDGKSFRTEHQWSRTTSKHMNRWLAANRREDTELKPQKWFDDLYSS
jgi:hypothetical protein